MKPEAQINEVRRIFSRVAPVYDLLNRVLSLREDVRWRNFVARSLRPGPTGRVLDVACGTGDLALAMAARPHRPKVIGVDLVPAMLGPARRKIEKSGGDVEVMAADAMALPFRDACFDCATIAFGIRNIPDRIGAMREMLRCLVPGGRIYVLEFTLPEIPWVRALYSRYLVRLLPKLGGLISGDQASYAYLAETIMSFPAPEAFRAEMAAAGFARARSHALTKGIAWVHVADKPRG